MAKTVRNTIRFDEVGDLKKAVRKYRGHTPRMSSVKKAVLESINEYK